MDSTSVDLQKEAEPYKAGFKGLRIGIPKEYFIQGMDPDMAVKMKKVQGDLILKKQKEDAMIVMKEAKLDADLARKDRQADAGIALKTRMAESEGNNR